MSTNGTYTTGRDVTLNIITPSGELILPGLKNFSADPFYTDLKSKLITGRSIFDIIPDGWKGMFQLDRFNRDVDNYFAALESNYFQGIATKKATILETINETDGSISQWRFVEVTLKLDKAGEFSGDKQVEQSISWMSSERKKVQ